MHTPPAWMKTVSGPGSFKMSSVARHSTKAQASPKLAGPKGGREGLVAM